MVKFLKSRIDERADFFGRQARRPAPFDQPADETDHLVAIDALALAHGSADDAHSLAADQLDDAVGAPAANTPWRRSSG